MVTDNHPSEVPLNGDCRSVLLNLPVVSAGARPHTSWDRESFSLLLSLVIQGMIRIEVVIKCPPLLRAAHVGLKTGDAPLKSRILIWVVFLYRIPDAIQDLPLSGHPCES